MSLRRRAAALFASAAAALLPVTAAAPARRPSGDASSDAPAPPAADTNASGWRPTVLFALAGAALFIAIVAAVATRSSSETLPLLILIGVGAVPVAIYLAFRVSPALTAAIGICLSVFGGNWAYVGTHLPLDRVLIGLSLLSLIYQRRTSGAPRVAANRTHVLLLVTASYAVVSAALASTLLTQAGIAALLDRFTIVGFLLYGVAPILFPTRRERQYVITALVILGGYLSLTTLAEGLGVNQLVFPRYILDPALGTLFGRARGPFLEASANGLALVVCAAACQVAVRMWRSHRAQIAAGVVGAACLGSVIFTLTRQDWVGAALAVAAALGFTPDLRRYLIPTIVATVLIVLGALAIIPGLRSSVTARTDSNLSNLSIDDRLNSDSAALRMVVARPLLGFGWDRYAADSGPYYRLASSYPLNVAVNAIHNVPLSNLVELGFLGAGLWLASLIAAFGQVLRRPRETIEENALWTSVLMCVVCYAVVAQFTPLSYEFDNITIWLFAGLLASARHERLALEESVIAHV
jgi:putative inorganic carbon (hco3(-)) transporter